MTSGSPETRTTATTTSLWLMAAIIMVVAFGVYYRALGCGFVYDDTTLLLNNRWIRDTRYLPEIFSGSFWGFSGERTNYYRPLLHVIFMTEYHIFGLKPWGFHLTNLLFHAGTSALVFLTASRLMPTSRTSNSYMAGPFLASILFATHPVHTESVAWVVGLTDVSCAFFYLLSFYSYTCIENSTRAKAAYFTSVASYLLASLCKEPGLTLPLMLIAYDYSIRKERGYFASNLKRYIPYLVIAFIYMIMRVNALGGFSPEKSKAVLSSHAANLSLLFLRYLQKLLFPINLNVLPDYHPVGSTLTFMGLFSLLCAAGFMALLFLAAKKNGTAFLGLLFIVLPLLPALYILASGMGASGVFAERYLYLPVFGLALLLVLPVERAINNSRGPAGAVSASIIVVLATFYSIGTIERNSVWVNELRLWTDTIKKSPDNFTAHNNLGLVFKNEGWIDKAEEEFQTAIRLKPDSPEAHNNLGFLYNSKGMADEAIEEFLKAATLKKDFTDAYVNLGLAYKSKGMMDEAAGQFQKAIRLNPNSPDAYNNLGLIYASNGQTNKAIELFKTAIRVNPDSPDSHNNLGVIYAGMESVDAAIEEFRTAVGLKPDFLEARVNLGVAYYSKGWTDKAVEQLETAVIMAPDDAALHVSLGTWYAQQGIYDKAVEQFKAALDIQPGNEMAKSCLTDVLKEAGRH